MQSQYGDSFNSEQYEKEKHAAEAAPELLEALEYATATLFECVGKGVSLEKQSIGLAIDTARKAIAKAKGE